LNSRTVCHQLSLFLLLLSLGPHLNADVIDPFTAVQGPFAVGPGEFISLEEGVLQTPSVLGGVRVVSPGMGGGAAAGSVTTMEIGGGVFSCSIDFAGSGGSNNGGGCSTFYDDQGAGPTFDLSGSTQFELDVQSVEGGITLAITIWDSNDETSFSLVENLTAGQLIVEFDQMFSLGPGADLSAIDNISLGVINSFGSEGSVSLGAFSTDGPIVDGPIVPGNGDDEIQAEEVSGTYFNPARDGEGCQLTLERDGVTFILTCYFYQQGKQFWLIGVGVLEDGVIVFSDMTITGGAGYGDDFNAADVIRTSWGSIIMAWTDCNNALLDLRPVLSGFENWTLTLTKIVPNTCGDGGVQGDALPWMGTYFGPARDGEGFMLSVEGDGSTFVMTWYTYLNGEQVWLIGVGTRNGNRLVFEDVVITSGASFGSEFDAADVIRRVFGTITVDFSDCNNFIADVDTVLPEFHDVELDVTKIVAGLCP
jgi:hypothetical protein